MTIRIETGDCLEVLRGLPECLRVNCCVTSPPYFGQRDYDHPGQIGLERTSDEYVAKLVDVFREVRRVLRDDGTLWLNLGDSYREKSLLGIPWLVAFALLADGWYLRSDIIWHKSNAMPDAAVDRPTKAHEYLFLLSKSRTYYYDAAAIEEAASQPLGEPMLTGQHKADAGGFTTNGTGRSTLGTNQGRGTRNRRSVWTVATQPYGGAHFAAFPPALIEPCIKAGCPVGGTVLDPFGGAGTTGLVADRLQRNALLIELNPEYADLAKTRIQEDAPLFASIDTASGL
jgi:DNA modification methylase